MNADKYLSGEFSPRRFVLTINVSGNDASSIQGAVTSNPSGINCSSGKCSASFDAGTRVELEAVPIGFNDFGGWGGNSDQCAYNPIGVCYIIMNADDYEEVWFQTKIPR
jgi:hypothetical protein